MTFDLARTVATLADLRLRSLRGLPAGDELAARIDEMIAALEYAEELEAALVNVAAELEPISTEDARAHARIENALDEVRALNVVDVRARQAPAVEPPPPSKVDTILAAMAAFRGDLEALVTLTSLMPAAEDSSKRRAAALCTSPTSARCAGTDPQRRLLQ